MPQRHNTSKGSKNYKYQRSRRGPTCKTQNTRPAIFGCKNYSRKNTRYIELREHSNSTDTCGTTADIKRRRPGGFCMGHCRVGGSPEHRSRDFMEFCTSGRINHLIAFVDISLHIGLCLLNDFRIDVLIDMRPHRSVPVPTNPTPETPAAAASTASAFRTGHGSRCGGAWPPGPDSRTAFEYSPPPPPRSPPGHRRVVCVGVCVWGGVSID